MSSTMRKPWSITAVHTCTLEAPRRRNSTASRQVEMPPIPLMGRRKSGLRPSSPVMNSAMGFTAGPQ